MIVGTSHFSKHKVPEKAIIFTRSWSIKLKADARKRAILNASG